MGGSSKTTTSQSSQPWDAAQPYLKDVLAGAQTAYKSGTGFDPFPGSTVVPFSPQTLQSQQQTQDIAGRGNPLNDAAMNATQGIINSGGGINTEGDLRSLLGQSGNPYYAGVVNQQAGQLADDINRGFSANGRYGSQAQVNDLSSQIGDFRNKAMSDQWNQNIANQRGIIGDISGVEGQNTGNVMAAANLSPTLYDQQYAPARALAGVGAQNEDLATRTLQDAITKFQTTQQAPWQRLSAYNALIGGQGQLGGTSTQTATQPGNPWQAVGAGLTGVGALAGK